MQFLLPNELPAERKPGGISNVYRRYQLQEAVAYQKSGTFGTILSQRLPGTDYSIWKHDFFIEYAVLLHPYVSQGLHTINYMLKGNISCELLGFGKVQLTENTYNLYYVPPVKQNAWLLPGYYSCLHVNPELNYLEELADEFPSLKTLLDSGTEDHPVILQQENYPMDYNVRVLLKDIMGCKKTGASRSIFLRARIYDLLLLFTSQLLKQENAVFKVDRIMLDEVQAYILANLHNPVTIESLSRQFGINQTSLRRNFKIKFGVPIHHFLKVERLKAAKRLLHEGLPVLDVAFLSGYQDNSAFSKAFRLYYGMTPSQYREQQN